MEIRSQLLVDTSVLQAQAALLKACIEAMSDASELDAFRQQIPSQLDRMCLDVVHGDGVSASVADGSVEVRYVLRLGAEFERVLAAFRTGKFDG